jgi:DNA-binding beta-propeller fold protein YncE
MLNWSGHCITEVPCSGSSTPTLRHVIGAADGGSGSVVGVNSVDDRLFVLRWPSKERIEVYELKTFTLQQTLQVTGLSDNVNNGLTACVMNKCLYVSDCKNAAAYKVELRVDNKISKWSVGGGPMGLSINSACNLLVACFSDKKIAEYETRSGSLVREIRLASNDGKSLYPWHVIELTSGQFLVSCRVGKYPNDVYDVVEVDVNGRVVVSYTNQLQSTNKQNFRGSYRLAVDKNNECILVADCNNNRIVILSRSLNRCAREFDVTSLHGRLREPSCVHFDESQRRLFLGELDDPGRMLVFDNVFL